ncbi:hypothetical protein CHUAL_009887 [Chamberlinius hualienensis]
MGNALLPKGHIKPENVTGILFDTCAGMLENDPDAPPYQLYNIDDDPLEYNDLATTHTLMVKFLRKKAEMYKREIVAEFATPNNLIKYMSLSPDLKILNTNWCNAIETVTPLYQ